MRMRWYFLFFLVSGFCSLVYEVVWLRLSMAMFGITTPMVSIVLSVFMAGLGLGSWGGGSLIRKLKISDAAKSLRLYGLTEILIGISGLMVPLLLNWGHGILVNIGRQLVWNSSAYYLASGLWVAISLLPWCTCMGATIPFAMAAMRMTAGDESQRSFSYLYLANVLGAIFGTLVPAFLLIEMLGFRGTLYVASSLNGILASAVFLLSFRSAITAQAPTSQTSSRRTRLYSLSQSSVLWLLFTTGVCSMAMEIVWIRLFTVYLGNVVYAFAAILALYLGATFIGSSAYRWWVRSYNLNDTAFLWALLGLTALLPLLCGSPSLPIPVLRHESQFALGAVRATLGIVPFSAVLGFLTPMLVDYWSGGDPDRGGRAYAVNVLGAILGPLMAGFLILPWLGDRWGLCVMSLPLFLIGLLISLREDAIKAKPQTSLRARGLFASVVLLSIPLVAMTKGIGQKDPQHIEKRDYTATVIATGSGMQKQVLVNGIGMTVLTPVTKFMGHMPLAFLNRPPENGLAICFGMGTTFRSMLSWGIDTTVVELVPSVPKLFGYFHSDGPELLKSPRSHVVIDDGRRFLERSTEKYDVITLDPPPPVGAPTSSLLYSREFYSIVKKHLRPGALVQVWLPGKDPGTHAAVAKALSDSFPYVRAFESLEGQEGQGFHFLASADAAIPEMSASQLASRLPVRAAADFVEWGPYKTAEDMFAAFLRGERPLASFVAEYPRVPPIDDDQPINEYFFLRWNFHYYR
jgi:spermidine synthase